MTANGRFWLVVAVMLIGVAGLIGRMVDLMVFERHFLLTQGDARSLRVVNIPAYRGMITDRNGKPLAISTPVDSVWIDPQDFKSQDFKASHFKTKAQAIKKMAKILKIPSAKISQKVKANKQREFVYIKRDVTPYIGKQVKALAIPGVFLQPEFRRYYPEGEVTAQLVGFTDIDDQGQAGEELAYNRWLEGVPGRMRVLKDRLGHVIADVDLLKAPRAGHNLALSIDRRIQYLAYRDLKAAVHKFAARSGSIVVLDVQTGEVLAMVNQPSFNPNDRLKHAGGRARNRAVTDVVEPGSTVKAFSVANALSSGLYTPSTIINTSPGWIAVDGHEVRDDADYGVLTVTGVLQKSSNVGVSLMTLSLPPNSLWHVLHAVGFGQRPAINFPGESAGYLPTYHTWNPFVLATLAFGYGLSVTNLQLAHAYAIIAAGGIKRPVSLLKLNKIPAGTRVMSAKVAHELLVMLQSVVEKGGTATLAQIPGYHVSGKTGTVRIVGPKGYEKNHHDAIFVGIAPATRPKLVVCVIIKDPRGGKFYGGLVAAPVFAKVMGSALRILDIAPDRS